MEKHSVKKTHEKRMCSAAQRIEWLGGDRSLGRYSWPCILQACSIMIYHSIFTTIPLPRYKEDQTQAAVWISATRNSRLEGGREGGCNGSMC